MNKLSYEEFSVIENVFRGNSIKKIISTSGGSINETFKIVLDDNEKIFLKVNSLSNYDLLAFEKEGLSQIEKYIDKDLINIPKPISLTKTSKKSLLILTWIEISNNDDERKLGEGIGKLHSESSKMNNKFFGYEKDGFIGYSIQKKGFDKQWNKFFANYRIKPQLNNFAKKYQINLDKQQIISKIETLLIDHNPKCSLVHGDLWRGNAATNKSGKGFIFDPSIWWADPEVDIAMTLLFGGFSQSFYDGYYKIIKEENGFRDRVLMYNLYHILNHANIFGGSYIDQSSKIITQIMNLY